MKLKPLSAKQLIIIKQLFLFSAIIICLQSCLGPKKINKWVATHYDGNIATPPKKQIEYITVTSTLVAADDKLSLTEKKTSHVLPLLFYWQFDYKNTCTLNPSIPVNNFTTTVMQYASKKSLKQKLNGQRLELSIEQIPNKFAVDDMGHVIWVIYAFGWDVFTVQPGNDDMIVSYKLMQDNHEIKKGTITIPNMDKTLGLKMYQSLKKKTWQYLDQYDANITAMSKLCVDKVITEIQ